jgi:hypothetical protein
VELVEELAVAAEAVGVEQDGLGGGLEGACDLAQGGARDQGAQHGREQPRPLEPVGGAEGLFAEPTPAVTAAETLDPGRSGVAIEETVADVVPSAWGGME